VCGLSGGLERRHYSEIRNKFAFCLILGIESPFTIAQLIIAAMAVIYWQEAGANRILVTGTIANQHKLSVQIGLSVVLGN